MSWPEGLPCQPEEEEDRFYERLLREWKFRFEEDCIAHNFVNAYESSLKCEILSYTDGSSLTISEWQRVLDAICTPNAEHYLKEAARAWEKTSQRASVTIQPETKSFGDELDKLFPDTGCVSEEESPNSDICLVDLNSQLKDLLAFDDVDLKSSGIQPKGLSAEELAPQRLANNASEGSLPWLAQQCQSYPHPTLDPIEMMTKLVMAMQGLNEASSEHESGAILDSLIDSLGIEAAELIENTRMWKDKLLAQFDLHSRLLKKRDELAGPRANAATGARSPNFFGGSVSTDTQRKFERKKARLRHEVEKIRLNAITHEDTVRSVLKEIRLGIIPTEVVERRLAPPQPAMNDGPISIILPEGATCKTEKGSTEIYLPAQPAFQVSNELLLPVKGSLPAWGEEVFRGIERFNYIQTKVFESIFLTQENVLVSAPTGAGKTNIALLAVLAAVKDSIESRGVAPSPECFKIIYIAPLKSLVAEISDKFSARLECLGVKVSEFTGDMPLTKSEQWITVQANLVCFADELNHTHLIVTVPEKWDVLTRNSPLGASSEKSSVLSHVALIVVDEVHLLGEDRGPVLEAVIARSFTYMQSSQRRHRLVALSATLPNWRDVAQFLQVPPPRTFVFNDSHRPIPLEQHLIGLTEKNLGKRQNIMNEVCYAKIKPVLKRGQQAMIFVHSRGDTLTTAQKMLEMAQSNNELHELLIENKKTRLACEKHISNCSHLELKRLLENGIGIHHAGIVRKDRKIVEHCFREGSSRMLVCTATLAWGVNLPARLVVIKGTNVFNSEKGCFADLDILDVLQIFGRAGRPDYDDRGEAILLTSYDRLGHYLARLALKTPLESHFLEAMPDHLNAEIAIGNISDLSSGAEWFRHTFAFVRMMRYHQEIRRIRRFFRNPIRYDVPETEIDNDRTLATSRRLLVEKAAQTLFQEHLIRLVPSSGQVSGTRLGRVAAKYYVRHETAHMFDKFLEDEATSSISDVDLLLLVSSAHEFEQLKVREDERAELARLNQRSSCDYPVRSSLIEEVKGKVTILIQAYINRCQLQTFSLISDAMFVTQSYGRLLRAFSELTLARAIGVSGLALKLIEWSKAVERKILPNASPLSHFCQPAQNMWSSAKRLSDRADASALKSHLVEKLSGMNLDELYTLSVPDIVSKVRRPEEGRRIYQYLRRLPRLELNAMIQPITSSILRITASILPVFEWNDRWSGRVEPFKLWLEDSDRNTILHQEDFLLKRASVVAVPHAYHSGLKAHEMATSESIRSEYEITVTFAVPIPEPRPTQYVLTLVSERWVGIQSNFVFNLSHLLLPHGRSAHTDLLSLNPMPVQGLTDPKLEALYNFNFFNPIQTQAFHTLYHTDNNVLVGAPTGSGKTICAEFAMFRLFRTHPNRKVIYVAPLKSLAKERLADWSQRLKTCGKSVVELSGDFTPDVEALKKSDVIITTPEKWDGISRRWQHRSYVRQVGLVIIDEIHLLGQDRGKLSCLESDRLPYLGAILEVIVSRMRYISAVCDYPTRFVGLSTALANATDIADWLGIGRVGLFNFRPAVRPVPCKVYVSGFSQAAFCPRMGTMNKPAYQLILEFSPDKPVLIFVSSRRQTRLTAQAIVMLAKTQDVENPVDFLHTTMDPGEFEHNVLNTVRDPSLRDTLRFGVGMHHAGLSTEDRLLAEKLFKDGTTRILVATSTLAWGVNLPAKLVILKGTEFYDGKTCQYVDMPITDVLQMIGRAGRPQFDTEAVACILIHEPKKQFYRRFLYEPFPVESSLVAHLPDHINAEIVSQAIATKRQAIDFLTWTYFFRRLHANPSYYEPSLGSMGAGFVPLSRYATKPTPAELMNERKDEIVNYVVEVIGKTIGQLLEAGCITIQHLPFQPVDDPQAKYDDDPLARIQLTPTKIGELASYYYLGYRTAALFAKRVSSLRRVGIFDVLTILCDSDELGSVPVRHSEDEHNAEWAKVLPLPLDMTRIDTGHVKSMALFQMHMFRMQPPILDYTVDKQSMLQNAIRLMQAFADTAAVRGSLSGVLSLCSLLQFVVQATNPFRSPLYCLPNVTSRRHLKALASCNVYSPCQLLYADPDKIKEELTKSGFSKFQWIEFAKACAQLPRLEVDLQLLVVCPDNGTEKRIQLKANAQGTSADPLRFDVQAESNLILRIKLAEFFGFIHKKADLPQQPVGEYAYAPNYPKGIYPSWWLIVGDERSGDLIEFQRVKIRRDTNSHPARSTINMQLKAPTPTQANQSTNISLHINSDVHVGIDQEVYCPDLMIYLLSDQARNLDLWENLGKHSNRC